MYVRDKFLPCLGMLAGRAMGVDQTDRLTVCFRIYSHGN
jgi:hypothetical protein